jgi:hypothetical protein
VTELPRSVTSVAFKAANGELAWSCADIDNALVAIRDAGLATLGVEVWRIVGPGAWDGLIPDRAGGPPGVWHWETEPRGEDESWQAYCERAAVLSTSAVRDIVERLRQEVAPDVLEVLRFNVTYVDENEV